jgi:phenylpropionate dioxygenase-like ring-hydroxylating dioxygenase large terminal subunit
MSVTEERRVPLEAGDGVLVELPEETWIGASSAQRWVDNSTPGLAASWYAVALSDEVDETPRPVTVLGRPWVLCRIAGRLTAFVDECPHRLAPLSVGCVEHATLQCRYHGWRFDADGACVSIPASGPDAVIPARARLRRPAGLQERYGLVWLAPEPPICDLPDFPEWDDPSYDKAWNAPRTTSVSAVQLCENFLDATHIPTVHAGTFGTTDAYLPPHTIQREGGRAHTTYEITYRNHDDPLVASGEHPLEQPQRLYKELCPATVVLIRLVFPLTGGTIAILFSPTPVDSVTTRIHKMIARNDLGGDADRMAETVAFEERVLDEDLELLEAYQRMGLSLDLREELHTRNDRFSVVYRRQLAALLAGDDDEGSTP